MNREKAGLINVKGDMLIDCKYDYIEVLDEDPNLIRVRKDDVDFYGIIDCRNRTIADLSAREDENGQYISIDDCFVGDNGTIDVYWSNGEEENFLITQVIKWYLIHLMTEHKVFSN